MFFYVVDPRDGNVASDRVFIAHDRYRPIARIGRRQTSPLVPIPSGSGEVYVTWDDTGARKYEVIGWGHHDFPADTKPGCFTRIIDPLGICDSRNDPGLDYVSPLEAMAILYTQPANGGIRSLRWC